MEGAGFCEVKGDVEVDSDFLGGGVREGFEGWGEIGPA